MDKILELPLQALQGLLSIIGKMPPALQLIVVLTIVGAVVFLYWNNSHLRHLRHDLVRANEQLRQEKEQLEKRIESMEKVDTYVWTRPIGNASVPANLLNRKTRFIAFCNLKGGVGKTTLTVGIGSALALAGKRVLLVDLDFQGTLSNAVMDPTHLKVYRDRGWTSEVLLVDNAALDVVSTYSFPVPGVSQCGVIIAKDSLDRVEFEQQARFVVDGSHEIRFLLRKLFHSEAICKDWDYVLFDCPPRLSTGCINALACADYVLIPTSLSQADIDAVPRTLNTMKELHQVVRAQLLGVIICGCTVRGGKLVKFDEGQRNNLEILISRHFPGSGHLFSTLIPFRPSIGRSAGVGSAAFQDQEDKQLFEHLAQELENRLPRP